MLLNGKLKTRRLTRPKREHDDKPVYIPGGTFSMGSDAHYPEEAPVRQVRVASFWIDPTPVTNRQFAGFARATGYVTTAEKIPDPTDYPEALPNMLFAGSLVFDPPADPVDLRHSWRWWAYRKGANWRHPYGLGSSIAGRDHYPVVHVTFEDALAYASWAGRVLPSEAEWEFAARGGLDGAEFAWGDEFAPNGKHMANTWQGHFPGQNSRLDGYERTSPVKTYPPNAYGLYDMIGNVWEWTTDYYTAATDASSANCCSISENPRGGRKEDSYDPCQPAIRIPRKVLKGGSHLCAPNYCRRYRPAARHAQPIDTSTCHVGFRCIRREEPVRPAEPQRF
jgi:formylglycine-generating enzyme